MLVSPRFVLRSVPAAVAIALVFASSALAQKGDAPSPPAAEADDYDRLRVGDTQAGRIVVPTNQVLTPQGRQVVFSDRPTDVALSPDGRWLGVLSKNAVSIIDVEGAKLVSGSPFKGSYAGITFTPDGKKLFASNMTGSIGVLGVSDSGALTALAPIELAPPEKLGVKTALPIGLAFDSPGTALWAVLNTKNVLAKIDPATRQVTQEIAVGNAPFGLVLVAAAGASSKAYVSNWAGRRPAPGDRTGPSGGATPVRVDERNIADDGSVSVVDLAAGKEIKQIPVGLHPAGIVATPDGKLVCVANANSDTVSVIDTARDEVVETIPTRPAKDLLFGSAPNALAVSPDGRRLFVSNGANNAILVVGLSPPHSRLLGSIPTAWYPAGLALDARRNRLYVANVKGTGSRSTAWEGKRKIQDKPVFGFNSHDHSGSVSLIDLPADGALPALTAKVLENNRLTAATSALAPPRADAPPRPVPLRHGEPSLFKHVLYIIKENRTYDQVFGDVERGEGDADLCIFGRDVTPNHHRLAEQFVQLDNFYCSGVLSADGHQWTDEAFVSDYVEKGFGEFLRSYPFDGNDALAYASSGFLWDNVLEHKKTLRIYGEFVTASIRWKEPGHAGGPSFTDCYRDFLDGGGKIEIRAAAGIKTLEPYLCPTAIGFPSNVPDVYRAGEFIKELKDFESRGELPNLMIMLLPNDHTSATSPGYPTPAASVADNDLALGRVIEAVSHSRFWPETCIFVVEDDPQNGFDHIDGHRTVALVASPYTRRGALVSTNFNQTGLVRTIELILGLKPMNQFDSSATPMLDCFTDQADLTPYTAVPNTVPLDQLNPPLSAIRDERQLHWAQESLELELDEVDEADEDTLNRILWHARRGRDDTYPAWAVNE
ncbi:MAG TPA: bifunctional YncE family protein/alkaline phosphatase family protein [Pirellulales bacterium]|nr:bifunctional YncE family protein/alkaline phosphatase family protein [Pirellulales bacterium]